MVQFFNNVLTKKRTLQILLQKCENSYGALYLWQLENIESIFECKNAGPSGLLGKPQISGQEGLASPSEQKSETILSSCEQMLHPLVSKNFFNVRFLSVLPHN